MNLNEAKLARAFKILKRDNFTNKVFDLMARSGSEILNEDCHQEMEVAFWQSFTDAMLMPFDKKDHPRILLRYAAFISGIFEEAAGMPLPNELDDHPSNTQAPAGPDK